MATQVTVVSTKGEVGTTILAAAKVQESVVGPAPELDEDDPIEPTPMAVPIDRILEYDRNPRRARNEAYVEIETSIRRRGFVGTLPITRRPGECHYRVAEGNTVLRILKDLYEETQDPRFHIVQCLFEPWVSESETLIAHLVENDARGELLFIDRARAVSELRGLLEQEAGQNLSTRELTATLRARGYTIDPATISRMDFAVDVLSAVLPIALRSGLGPSQIDRIRKLHKITLALLRQRKCELSLVEETQRWFLGCLARHDSERWLLEPVECELEVHLAEVLGESKAKVKADLQGISEQDEPSPDAPPATATAVIRPRSAGVEAPPAPASSVPDVDTDAIARAGPKRATNGFAEDVDWERSGAKPTRGEEQEHGPGPARSRTPAKDPKPQDRPALPQDLKSLRGRMWTLASQLASRSGLSDCILLCSKGCGFLIDLPPSRSVPPGGRRRSSRWRQKFYTPTEFKIRTRLYCSSSRYIKETTTTTSDQEPEGKNFYPPLVYPEGLSENERRLAEMYLRDLEAAVQQALLDELGEKIRAQAKTNRPVRNPIGLLAWMCKEARAGQPPLTSAHLQYRARRERERLLREHDEAEKRRITELGVRRGAAIPAARDGGSR